MSIKPSKCAYKLSSFAKDHVEQLHLSFLKWTIGVGRRTSNAATWGDSGRVPVGITLLKQVFGYVKRLIELEKSNPQSLVCLAFKEQVEHNLSWYKGISSMFHAATNKSMSRSSIISPGAIQQQIGRNFCTIWDLERLSNKKLGFYNSVKEKFGMEDYLIGSISFKEQKCLAQIRMSAHKLKIETGRYQINRENPANRACPTCTDIENAQLLKELPFFEPIIEDERHVLLTCSKYHDIRLLQCQDVKARLFADLKSLFTKEYCNKMARFVRKIFNRRFPQQETKSKDCPSTPRKPQKEDKTK